MPARDPLYDSCTYVCSIHESSHPNGAHTATLLPGLASGNSGGRPSRVTGPSFADRGGFVFFKTTTFRPDSFFDTTNIRIQLDNWMGGRLTYRTVACALLRIAYVGPNVSGKLSGKVSVKQSDRLQRHVSADLFSNITDLGCTYDTCTIHEAEVSICYPQGYGTLLMNK